MTRPIEAVVVGIPAHDEEATIGACLSSLVIAAERVDVPVRVVVAVDACTDRTLDVVSGARIHGRRAVHVEAVRTVHRSAGAARADAIDAGLRLVRHDDTAVWVATTDADTIVHPSWLAVHLAWAHAGIDAIAGLVDVAWQADEAGLAQRYATSIEEGGSRAGHSHVHGANLGVRADWWRGVGGCGRAPSGEDHELWARLKRGGAQVIGVDDLLVTTSSRRTGRAPDGFAGYLAALG